MKLMLPFEGKIILDRHIHMNHIDRPPKQKEMDDMVSRFDDLLGWIQSLIDRYYLMP